MANPFDDPKYGADANPFDDPNFDGSSSKLRRVVGDAAISAAKGVIGVGEAAIGVADLASGGRAGKALEDVGVRPKAAKGYLDEQYTPEQQAANKAVSDAKGFLPTVGAALQNPSVIGHSIVESAPSIFAGGAVARGVRALGAGAVAAGAAGEGAVGAGLSAEQIRQKTKDGLLTPEQALLAAGSGAATAAITGGAGAAAKRMGITDVDTLLAGGGTAATNKGIIRRGAEGAFSEGVLEELPQSMQEQAAQNLALGRPVGEGVAEAGALGMLTGAPIGGAVSALGSRQPPAPPPAEDPLLQLPAPGQTTMGMGQGEPGQNLELEAADMYAGSIRAARAAEEERKAGLKVADAETPPDNPLKLLPKPGDIAAQAGEGPISVISDYSRQAAADNLARITGEREAEESRLVELAANGPLSTAAALAIRGGAAKAAYDRRSGEVEEAGQSKESPLAMPDAVSDIEKQAQEGLDAYMAHAPAGTLAQAQLAVKKALDAGDDYTVVPHPSGQFTIVPTDRLPPRARETVKSIQTPGKAPPNPFIPIAKPEAAKRIAEQQTARTGIEHEVIPHPLKRDAYAVRPVAQPSTAKEVQPPSNEVQDAAPETASAGSATESVAPPVSDEISARANEAATSLENDLPQPTAAQAAAGNYKKGHVKVQGLDITVENPDGSVRVDKKGEWASTTRGHYGYIRRTEGADGDHVDVNVGPNPDAPSVFVVNQNKPDGSFDEHKVMLGYDTQEAAEAAYRANFPADWNGFGGIVATDPAGLKTWLKSGAATAPFSGTTAPEIGTPSRSYLPPPSSNLHAAAKGEAAVDPASVPELKGLFDAPPMRLTDLEDAKPVAPRGARAIAAGIKEALRLGLPPVALKGLRPFHVYKEKVAGVYYGSEQSIGISQDVLNAAHDGDPLWSKQLVGFLSHELGHHISGDPDGDSFANESPAFDIEFKDGKRRATGPVVVEALAAWGRTGKDADELHRFLNYPLVNWSQNTPANPWPESRGQKPVETSLILKDEVFAQLFSLYLTNPQLMQRALPRGFNLMQEVVRGLGSQQSISGARRAVRATLRSWRPAGRGAAAAGRGDQAPAAGSAGERQPGAGLGSQPGIQRREVQAGDDSRNAGRGLGDARVPAAPADGREEGSAPLVGLPSTSPGPLAIARDAARSYMKKAGLPYNPPTDFVKVDPAFAKKVADAYDAMKHEPNALPVKAAYAAMIRETLAQWDAIKATGLKVHFADDAHPYPYSIPSEVFADVRDNNTLWVFPTDAGFGSSDFDPSTNPLLGPTGETIDGRKVVANDIFRIVHDYFGHIKEGVGFRANGEENAWRIHSTMYSPLARRALTSETRGQNSWVNWGPHGEKNRTASGEDTVYADQKTGLLPQEFVDDSYAKRPDALEIKPEVLVKEIPELKAKLKHLLPEERSKLRRDTARKFVKLFEEFPSGNEMAAVAFAGKAKRGWYKHSAEALVHMFGPDAPRFAALLAAMSPQTSVESNLRNALRTWINWVDAGRPKKRSDIIGIMGRSVDGNKLTDSVLDAWVNNSIRALTNEDPVKAVLSGPKVHSFMRNLMGVTEEVTNDAWMASFAAVEQTLFSGSINKAGTEPGKSPGYLAMSARVREAAKILTRLTKEIWTPAEVQETIWSWAKTVYEAASAKGENRTALELLNDGAITDALINATPDFRTLFNDEPYASILRKGGLAEQLDGLDQVGRAGDSVAGEEGPEAGSQAAPFDRDTQTRLVSRAARRLDDVREQRIADSANAALDDAALDEEVARRPDKLEIRDEPIFESGLAKAIAEKAPFAKAGEIQVGQLRMWLSARAKDGTVKSEELKFSGLDDQLAQTSGKISRARVAEMLENDGVKVDEVMLGGLSPYARGEVASEDVAAEYQERFGVDPVEAGITEDDMASALGGEAHDNATKFESYQLPGGENYRELLLKLPVKEQGEIPEGWELHDDALRARADGYEVPDSEIGQRWTFRGPGYASRVYRNRAEAVAELKRQAGDGNVGKFKSSHFEQHPNILAHIRFNERTDADGKRVLFIEELQSDWAQQGRKEGFSDPADRERELAIRDQMSALAKDRDPVTNQMLDEKAWHALAKEREALDRKLSRSGGIPAAPFVGKTEAWVGLALKRMVRYAADNGFDRIAWTTGEQQADRYDLSKQINSIEYEKVGAGYYITAYDLNGNARDMGSHAESALPDVVGKEVAQRMVQGAGKPVTGVGTGRDIRSLSGLDLKVGGEGMRAFYDKIVPNVANDLLKKMGGGRVVEISVRASSTQTNVGNEWLYDAIPQPGFDVAPISERAKRPQALFISAAPVQQAVADMFTSQRGFNRWWHRTVGTQFHKAQTNAEFKKVFDGVQDYLNDASQLMNEAADLAPDLLPKLEGLKGILGATASKKDIEAVSSAVFRGTLADVVYADATAAGLSPEQFDLYKQARASIDTSLAQTFASEAVKQARDLLPQAVLDQAKAASDGWVIVNALSALPTRTPVQQQAYDQLRDRAAKISDLQRDGYAPLMRFGQYTVHVRNADGSSALFTMHESQREANAFAREVKATLQQGQVLVQNTLSQDAWTLFQGVSPDTLSVFAEAMSASDKEVFQKYLQFAVNNRSTLKRMLQRKEIAGFSTDVQRTLAQFVTSNARAASRNYHWGDILKQANKMREGVKAGTVPGDVVDEAIGLVNYVQNPKEEAGALRGLLFIQFLGGSVASALTNATQPILMTFPYLSRFGAVKAAAALTAAGKVAAGGIPPEQDLRAALERARKEGVTAPHEVAGLYAESIRNLGSNLTIRRATRAWGSLFSLAEGFNRRITFVAAYRLAKEAGEPDPYAFAINTIAETQGVYNKGNRPNWARGPVGATLMTFKQYSVSYVEFLKRLPPKERAIAIAVLIVAAGVQGLPGADDLEDVVDTIAQSLGYNWNSEREARLFAQRVLGDTLGEMVTSGVSGIPGVPLDVSARLGVGNLIPGTSVLKRSTTDRGRDVLEFFGPAGSQVKAVFDAAKAAQEGESGAVARSILPVAIQNALKGVDMGMSGYYKDMKGRRVIDVDAYDAAIKAIGFQPKRVANQSRAVGELMQDVTLNKEVESNIADKWARAIVDKDPAKVAAARAELLDWNQKNQTSQIRIVPQQIQRRVQQLLMTRDERFVKTVPKELRQLAARELAQ